MLTKKRGLSNCNRPLPGVLMAFSISIMEELNTPLSLSLAQNLREGDLASVVKCPGLIPTRYTDAMTFKKDYLASEMMSKFPSDIGIDRASVAIEAFLDGETSCSDTNSRFSSRNIQEWTFWERSVMETARLNIENLLGPFNWDLAARYFSFGPGATSSLSRRNASTENKLEHGIAATPAASLLATCIWEFNQGWKNALDETHTVRPRLVRGSRIITVPKNAKTDRVIAIEPDLNMYLQKGLGGLIRSRLRKAGLDLNTAWMVNHELAKSGSVWNNYATIDLKSASDTISLKLVEFLLPPDWFEALNESRSHKAVLPSGEWVTLQKFSSMGNGFTFELESMIFYALARAAMSVSRIEGRITVFGDDIIVPYKAYNDVRSILEHSGFQVNEKKTFFDGPFRESCGKHYFLGYDVTPFYLRKEESTLTTVLHALNRAREWSIHPVFGLDGLEETYNRFREKLPSFWRHPRIPYGYGDGALWGDFDEVLPQKAPRGAEGWIVPVLLPSTKAKLGRSRFSVLASLMKLERVKEPAFLRPATIFDGCWKKGRMLVTQWPQHGSWHSSFCPEAVWEEFQKNSVLNIYGTE